MTRIGVAIPVGPEEHHATWLGECLRSVREQERPADYIVLVDDMHGLYHEHRSSEPVRMEVYRPPWRLGVAVAFNAGVSLLHQRGCDLALMLGADDVLQPRVLANVEAAYDANGQRDGYYWCEVEYQDGTVQGLPCNNAAVTAGFMRQTGGLPVDASAGAMDSALISALLVHRPELLVRVPGGDGARFWSRQHEHQESARLNQYGEALSIVRTAFTEHFEAPRWGRYA